MDKDLCKRMHQYKDSLKNKQLFELHIQILRSSLGRKVIQAYLEESEGYLTDLQKRAVHTLGLLTPKMKWLQPLLEKRITALEPDITRLLHDATLRTKLSQLLATLIKQKC